MTEGKQSSTRTAAGWSPDRKHSLLWVILPVLLAGSADASLSILSLLREARWQYLLDAAGTISLALLALAAWIMDRRGRRASAAWMLILGIALVMFGKTIASDGIGTLLGLAGLVILSVIAFVYLPTAQVNRAISAGYIAGAVTLLLETFWPLERVASPLAGSAIGNAIVIAAIAIGYPLFIYRQFRYFNLYTKLMIAFSLTAVLPAIFVGWLNYSTSQARLTASATQALQTGANQTAQAIERLLQSKEDAIVFQSRSPLLANYLSAFTVGGNADLMAIADVVRYFQQILAGEITYLQSIAILDPQGEVVYDTTTTNVGQSEAGWAYFDEPMTQRGPYVSPVYVDASGQAVIVFSAPILDEQGATVGVLRGRYLASILQATIEPFNDYAGPGSYALLLDENQICLANGQDAASILRSASTLDVETLARLQEQGRLPAGTPEELSLNQPDLAAGLAQEDTGIFYIARRADSVPGELARDYRETAMTASIPARESRPAWAVVYAQPEEGYLGQLNTQIRLTLASVAGVILFAVIGSWGLANLLTRPLLSLRQTAQQIEAGNLEVRAQIHTQDEVGELALTINAMTARLRSLVGSLEERVAERTRALERRARQIQAAADVGSIASRLRNLDQLLKQATFLIGQRFDFYHVGIFLLDERGEYAVLHAANSEGGMRMIESGRRLKVGGAGIVGSVTGSGEPRIALDVGQDRDFTRDPELPNTRSELCLPLFIGGEVIGAIDVQSQEEAAFSEDDVATLNIMAEQLAISIDNARLISESRTATEAAQRAYGEISQASWKALIEQRRGSPGFLSSAKGAVLPVSGEAAPEYTQAIRTGQPVLANGGITAYVPIRSRDLVIGAIRLDKPAGERPWSVDDLATANSLADQLSTSLDSARLFQDINRQAAKEHAISEISGKISASINLEGLFETAAREIGRAFPGAEVLVQLKEE